MSEQEKHVEKNIPLNIVLYLSNLSYIVWFPIFFAGLMYSTDDPHAQTGIRLIGLALIVLVAFMPMMLATKLSPKLLSSGARLNAFTLAGLPLLINVIITTVIYVKL